MVSSVALLIGWGWVSNGWMGGWVRSNSARHLLADVFGRACFGSDLRLHSAPAAKTRVNAHMDCIESAQLGRGMECVCASEEYGNTVARKLPMI